MLWEKIFQGRWILGLWTSQGEEQKGTDLVPGLIVAVVKEAGCVLERHKELVKGALWVQNPRRAPPAEPNILLVPTEFDEVRLRQQPVFGRGSENSRWNKRAALRTRFSFSWAIDLVQLRAQSPVITRQATRTDPNTNSRKNHEGPYQKATWTLLIAGDATSSHIVLCGTLSEKTVPSKGQY